MNALLEQMERESGIELWTARGVPYDEIVSRLSERSSEECGRAVRFMAPQIPPRTKAKIMVVATEERSSVAILRHWEKGLAKEIYDDDEGLAMLELHALMFEGIWRAAHDKI